MLAAIITRPGPPDVLELRDMPRPEPREGEVLVRVRASALNRADLLQRQGKYPAPPGAPENIPGLEFAGEVAELGANVAEWRVGDRVFGIIGGGGHAEFAVTRANEIARVPDALSWEDAAAIPEAFMTAHDALVTQARIQPGDHVLVHAVGSGVGLAAAQLVAALGGICIGTARTDEKIERAREHGLKHGAVVSGDPQRFVGDVMSWTGGTGADIVLDLVGGPYTAASVECAASQGRVVLIGLLAGRAATINLGTVLTRRVTIRGTVLRSRTPAEKAAVTAAFARDVLPLIERGTLRAVVDRVFDLRDIAAAHALLESNSTFGKVVVRV